MFALRTLHLPLILLISGKASALAGEQGLDTGDTAWLLVSIAWVLLMSFDTGRQPVVHFGRVQSSPPCPGRSALPPTGLPGSVH